MGYSTKLLPELTGAAVVADTNTAAFTTESVYGVSVQATWTSTTAAATIKLQLSNDGTNWGDHASVTFTVNNDSKTEVKETTIFSKYFRILVDHSSGSITTLSVLVNTKG